MKYMCQLGIILLFSLLGELLHALIPGPVPASIYGFVLLLVCLYTKVIKLEMVEEAADFLTAQFAQMRTASLTVDRDMTVCQCEYRKGAEHA